MAKPAKPRGKIAPKAKTERMKAHQWAKGQSGNPAGRPKSSGTLLKELRTVINQPDPRSKEGLTYLQTIARKMCCLAAQGSVRAFREIRDTLEGKPKQSIALSGTLEGTDRQSRVERILGQLETLKADGGSR